MTTDAAKSAKARYDAKTARYISLKLNKNTDADIISRLEQQESIQAYIKSLIRNDMKGAKTMTTAFEQKVLREGIVDTKQYRYIAKVVNGAEHQWTEIRRLPISSLDTTDAIDGWETVKVLGETD